MLDDDSTIFMLPPSPPESRLVPDFGPRSELLAQHDNFASTPAESIGMRLWWQTWTGRILTAVRAVSAPANGLAHI